MVKKNTNGDFSQYTSVIHRFRFGMVEKFPTFLTPGKIWRDRAAQQNMTVTLTVYSEKSHANDCVWIMWILRIQKKYESMIVSLIRSTLATSGVVSWSGRVYQTTITFQLDVATKNSGVATRKLLVIDLMGPNLWIFPRDFPLAVRWTKNTLLAGGAITILKSMSSSMGRMTSHIWNGK